MITEGGKSQILGLKKKIFTGNVGKGKTSSIDKFLKTNKVQEIAREEKNGSEILYYK